MVNNFNTTLDNTTCTGLSFLSLAKLSSKVINRTIHIYFLENKVLLLLK